MWGRSKKEEKVYQPKG